MRNDLADMCFVIVDVFADRRSGETEKGRVFWGEIRKPLPLATHRDRPGMEEEGTVQSQTPSELRLNMVMGQMGVNTDGVQQNHGRN